jgi:hypothetical protein
MFRRYLPAMVENLATDRHDSLPCMLPRDTAQQVITQVWISTP